MSKRTDSPGLGSLGSGALTGASTLVVSGGAAAVGVVIAREFGRTDETDGLLAAYGLFIVIVIAAQAIRIAVLPRLARARIDARLGSELAGFAVALAVIAVPLVVVSELGTVSLAELLTGSGSEVARDTATDALRWMVPAAVAHLFAGLAASGLAALDDYATAALGYAAGSSAGLALIVLRVEPDGIIAVAWGMILNGAIVLLVTVGGLIAYAVREGMPTGAIRPTGSPLHSRLGVFAMSAALPLGLQLLYVVSLPFVGRLGTGATTSFVYAYLAGSALVAVTASSLALVTSVPLTRSGLTSELVARHVAGVSWLAFAAIGPAAGVLVVAGADVVGTVLGRAYGGDVGVELGRLIALLTPWMVASVGLALTFPLVFIAERTGLLPFVAGLIVLAQIPLAWAGGELLGLEGIVLSLCLPTWLVFLVLLVRMDALVPTMLRLVQAPLFVGALTILAFFPCWLLFGPYVAATLGLVLYLGLLAVLRPPGLRASWRYLRTLS